MREVEAVGERPFGGHFQRLLEKYCVDVVLAVQGAGARDAGMWVPGEEVRVPLRGALVPLPARKLYQPGGVYTQADRQLLLPCTLAEAAASAGVLPAPGAPFAGVHVLHGGRRYAVEEEADHGDYAFVAVYLLRFVGLFDAGGAGAGGVMEDLGDG